MREHRLLFFGILVSLTTRPIVRSNIEHFPNPVRLGETRLPEGERLMQTAIAVSKLQLLIKKVSKNSATDLQISPDYEYPSDKHTDSFNLSADSH